MKKVIIYAEEGGKRNKIFSAEIPTNVKVSFDIEEVNDKVVVIEEAKPFETPKPQQHQFAARIAEVLGRMGIPASILGYRYIKDAVRLCLDDPDAINAVVKVIYTTVAKTNVTTPSRVERAIRHAIEMAWVRGDINYLQTVFSFSANALKGKTTNSEFIAGIVEMFNVENQQ
jgi:two-component system response regulator (stage 0 sporulation protein A)